MAWLACVTLAAPGAAQTGKPQPQAAQRTLTLADALQDALDHYPAVRAALEELNASMADISVARAAYLPRLDTVWQTNRATANNVFGQLLPQSVIPSLSGPVLPESSAQSAWGSAVGGLLSWEPFDLGLRGAAVREAEAAQQRARVQEGLTRLSVQSAVGNAFFSLATAERALTAAHADVARRDALARAAHTLADNQLRPGAEASRADAELAASRTRAIQAERDVTIARATLAQVLGEADAAISVDVEDLLNPPGPTDATPSGPEHHPLVEAGQAAVDLARARESVLARTDLPRVLVQSSVFARGTGAHPDGTFDGGASGLGLDRANWAAGVQVVVPNLFDFASLRARRAAAAASTRAETARHDEAVLAVTLQQRMAAAQTEAARAVAENTPTELAAARQGEAQARARYQAGLAGIVEVAESQNLLAAAEYQDAVARLDVWRALLAQAVAQGDISTFLQQLHSSGGR